MRGGLDDALDKLARRDELRRRAAGEATGTPPAVQELVEAIAGVVGRNPKRGEETVAEIRAGGGKSDFISSELRDASSAREVAKRAVQVGGGHVDILIKNAGIFPFGPTDQATEEMFDNVYSLNVKVPYFLVAELAPLMAKRGKGAIVNISTMAADYGVPGMSLYG